MIARIAAKVLLLGGVWEFTQSPLLTWQSMVGGIAMLIALDAVVSLSQRKAEER